MQMNALRSANLAKLSSSNATSDEYWLTSISDGTPGGYCLSQIRSMGLSPRKCALFVVCMPRQRRGRIISRSIGNAARYGKRLRAIDALVCQPEARLRALGPRHPGAGAPRSGRGLV